MYCSICSLLGDLNSEKLHRAPYKLSLLSSLLLFQEMAHRQLVYGLFDSLFSPSGFLSLLLDLIKKAACSIGQRVETINRLTTHDTWQKHGSSSFKAWSGREKEWKNYNCSYQALSGFCRGPIFRTVHIVRLRCSQVKTLIQYSVPLTLGIRVSSES